MFACLKKIARAMRVEGEVSLCETFFCFLRARVGFCIWTYIVSCFAAILKCHEGPADAMAEEFTYFCRCDVCRCSLFRGDNWYHKPGTNYDLCARDFAKLSASERQVWGRAMIFSKIMSETVKRLVWCFANFCVFPVCFQYIHSDPGTNKHHPYGCGSKCTAWIKAPGPQAIHTPIHTLDPTWSIPRSIPHKAKWSIPLDPYLLFHMVWLTLLKGGYYNCKQCRMQFSVWVYDT